MVMNARNSTGYVPSDRAIPAPDMSFMRLFDDATLGWQQRGQYAIWTGTQPAPAPPYRLFERFGQRIALIAHSDGRPLLHRIGAGQAFMVEGLAPYWLRFDSDAMWIDTPRQSGRSALLVVGGAAQRPGEAVIDWPCPNCGTALATQRLPIRRNGFRSFLRQAETWQAQFDARAQLRTCPSCGTVHPTTTETT